MNLIYSNMNIITTIINLYIIILFILKFVIVLEEFVIGNINIACVMKYLCMSYGFLS